MLEKSSQTSSQASCGPQLREALDQIGQIVLAKQITHAPEPALRGADAERDPVPVARDGERSLPNARGQVSRRADRE